MNVFFIDFETTGLNPYHDEIIEFAIKQKDTENFISNVVRPNKTKVIPPKITEITNITNDMVFSNLSITLINACELIFTFLKENYSGEGFIYLIAHNGIPFDFVILKTLIKTYANNIDNDVKNIDLFDIYPKIRFIDSLDVSRKLVKDLNSYSQKNLCRTFNIVQENAHRAYGDVEDLNKVYNAVIKYGINSLSLDIDLNNIKVLYDYMYSV
tara:strand:- start:504 stop:1139 length:636 start_codon:yes stop_codon:yes gene_type:complete